MTKSSLDAQEGWRGCPWPCDRLCRGALVERASAGLREKRQTTCGATTWRPPDFRAENLVPLQLFAPVLQIFRLCGKIIPRKNLVTRPFLSLEKRASRESPQGGGKPLVEVDRACHKVEKFTKPALNPARRARGCRRGAHCAHQLRCRPRGDYGRQIAAGRARTTAVGSSQAITAAAGLIASRARTAAVDSPSVVRPPQSSDRRRPEHPLRSSAHRRPGGHCGR